MAITEHAFEISKIMQSFAAGWFNKHALDKTPSDDSVTDFLKISFGKVREELRLEAMNNLSWIGSKIVLLKSIGRMTAIEHRRQNDLPGVFGYKYL